MIAQLSVFPIGEGTSLGRFVKKGVAVIEASGYTYEVGGMSTSVEVPDLDALFSLVKEIHAAHVEEGAKRIIIDLKVDDRRDKDATIATKKSSVKGS
ncbi:MAG: MTH1187 family thiamine-binding protein [Desulfatiglandaceae bacterium]